MLSFIFNNVMMRYTQIVDKGMFRYSFQKNIPSTCSFIDLLRFTEETGCWAIDTDDFTSGLMLGVCEKLAKHKKIYVVVKVNNGIMYDVPYFCPEDSIDHVKSYELFKGDTVRVHGYFEVVGVSFDIEK